MSLKTLVRVAGVTAVAATIAMAGSAAIVTAPASAAGSQSAGVDKFGACVAAQGKGRVLLMIDQSGSLQKTDSSNSRSTAATMLTQQLSDYSAATGSKLEIAVAGFSENYNQSLGWTSLDQQSLGTVDDAVKSTTAQQSGLDTDYWMALDGARKSFSQGRPTTQDAASSCQMLAWFTDGQLDFTPREGASKPYAPGKSLATQADVNAMIDSASTGICRDAGLADQLRTSDIVNIAIGLSGGGENPDFNLLKSIATGKADDGTKCGSVQGVGIGDFFPAGNIEDLLFAFDQISTPGQAPKVQEKGACAIKVCDEGKHRFVLDSTVSSVSILAAADTAGLTPYLVAPDGSQTRMTPGQPKKVDVNGVSVDYSFPSSKSVSIRMANATAPGWPGVWALVFVAPNNESAKTKSSIHITGGLRPTVADVKNLSLHSADKDTKLTLQIVDADGKTVDATSLPGTIALSATLVDAAGKSFPIAKDLTKATANQPQSVDLSDARPGAATIQLDLAVSTAHAREKGSNTEIWTDLEPVKVSVPVTVNPPLGYPTVNSRVDFGTVEGSGDFTANIDVTGPGCVWVDPAKTAFTARPDGADAVNISAAANSEASCRGLSDGQKTTLPVTLKVPDEVNGDVGGTITVMTAPDKAGESVPIEVSFTASLSKPLKTTQFTIALILALILGPLIPLLLLYLFKWLTSRIPAKALRAQQIPVTLSGTTLLRDNAPFALRDTDLVSMVPGLDRPTRSIDLGGVGLKTKTGWSPFGAGFVVGSAPGMAASADRAGATTGKTPDALLPLAVHNHWMLLHDPAGPETSATLVVMVSGDAGRPQIERMAQEIRDIVPRNLPKLRAQARKNLGTDDQPPAGGTPPPNPFGGGGPTPPGGPGGNPFGGNPFGGPPPARPGGFGPAGAPGGFPPARPPAPPAPGPGPGPGPQRNNPFAP